jgi:hypothetical protein
MRKSWKLKELVRHIYGYYAPHINKSRRPLVYAKDILSTITASQPTVIKARKLLGIESRKIAGRFCWTYPKRTIDQALDKEKKRMYICLNPDCTEFRFNRFSLPVSAKSLKCPSPTCRGSKFGIRQVRCTLEDLEDLKRNLRGYGYDAPATFMLKTATRLKRSRIYAAKKELGVKHYRTQDGFRWVLVSDEVKQWIEEQCSSGKPIAHETILSRAKEKGWESSIMLERCRLDTSIKAYTIKDKLYWRENPANVSTIQSGSYEAPELPDTPGGVIQSEDDSAYINLDGTVLESDEPDYLSDNKDDRERRWIFLYEGSKKSFKTRSAYNSYRNQMRQRYPAEYEKLADRHIDQNEVVKRLQEKVRQLEKRLK